MWVVFVLDIIRALYLWCLGVREMQSIDHVRASTNREEDAIEDEGY